MSGGEGVSGGGGGIRGVGHHREERGCREEEVEVV